MENSDREWKKENYSEVEKIQLIDFSSEDDILVDYPFRDSLQDLRLSGSFCVFHCFCNLGVFICMYHSYFCVYIF